MTLISQNAIVKHRVNKQAKRKDDESYLVEGSGEIAETGDSNVDTMISTKKRKKGHKGEEGHLQVEEEIEMNHLANSLFGSLLSPLEFGKDDQGEGGVGINAAELNDSALFILDRSGGSAVSMYEEDARNEDYDKQKKPVWRDDEEEKTVINISKVNRLRKLRKEEDETLISGSAYVSRLRAQHEKLNPSTHWANLDSNPKECSSDSDDESAEVVDDILRTNEELVVKRGAKLLPRMLEYSRLVDANSEDPSDSAVTSVQFHRNHQLLLAGGLDRKLRFFQIDGKLNKMMDVMFFEDCPIRKAAFLPNGSQVIISGRRKFFYILDIIKGNVDKTGPLTGRDEKSLEKFEISPDSQTIAFMGNEGYILLVSSKTKELMGTLKMNGTVRSLAFTKDGQHLLSSGGDGQVYFWDLRTRTCLHKGIDEGSINGTALCTSPVGNLFAAGSSSGIVNIYNQEEFLGGKRKPVKTLENLTTKVDFLKFNHAAQILAICSRMQKSGLKLVHIPSFTVFSNWPPPNKTVLHHPSCLDFSPAGGFMAVGNEKSGRVLLYKLHHYQQA